jgi:hypothetical protein
VRGKQHDQTLKKVDHLCGAPAKAGNEKALINQGFKEMVVDSGRLKQTLSENTTATDTSCRGLSGRVGLFKPANSRHPKALKITPQ